jgi:acetylornithine deacetylase
MPLPSMKEQFAALIAAPSVSCTQPSLDQTNRPVIDLLATWLGELGFTCDIQQVSPGKIQPAGQFRLRPRWPGAWPGTATPCRSTVRCGRPIR